MTILNLPVVHQWYQLANSESFRVISVDSRADEITIQYSDNARETINLDTWNKLDAQLSEHLHEEEEIDTVLEEIDFEGLEVAPGAEYFDSELLAGEDY